MIEKIVSGGQTGADQAALDAAIAHQIDHGGWVPKGRRTENGTHPAKYQLQEMETESYEKRTAQNVIDSDGTLIFSHGDLKGGSYLTKQCAQKYDKPYAHIDLNKIYAFEAAQRIKRWVDENEIRVLNVAGPRASKDPHIYEAVLNIMGTVFYLDMMGLDTMGLNAAGQNLKQVIDYFDSNIIEAFELPKTVADASRHLISKLSLKDKAKIAKLKSHEVATIYPSLALYIETQYRISNGNPALLRDCQREIGRLGLSTADPGYAVARAVWEKLKSEVAIRIVKNT